MTILNISEVTGPVVTNFIGLRAEAQGFEAIFLIFIIFHIIHDYTIIYSVIIYNKKNDE